MYIESPFIRTSWTTALQKNYDCRQKPIARMQRYYTGVRLQYSVLVNIQCQTTVILNYRHWNLLHGK